MNPYCFKKVIFKNLNYEISIEKQSSFITNSEGPF